jgi:predicted aminopeptidase
MRQRRLPLLFPLALSVTLLPGCSTIAYYAQSARGQLDLLWKREPITELAQRPDTPPELKTKLTRVLEMRDFASRELRLPDNASYRSYADLNRQHVVWTVYATPEFSMELREWCFPIAGCVRYRGYFSQDAAEKFGARLREEGDDVFVGGVDAYSTLGWFDDPVLNTFVRRKDISLAGLIFHELAHQQLYVKNDTAFNESFARTVELEGVRRWLQAHGTPEQMEEFATSESRRRDFVALVETTRDALVAAYAGDAAREEKRARKAGIYDAMRAQYAQLKQRWGGYTGYDDWFNENLNNAKLASVVTYADHVPAFQALLRAHDGDFTAFYAAAREIGELSEQERRERLGRLAAKP